MRKDPDSWPHLIKWKPKFSNNHLLYSHARDTRVKGVNFGSQNFTLHLYILDSLNSFIEFISFQILF